MNLTDAVVLGTANLQDNVTHAQRHLQSVGQSSDFDATLTLFTLDSAAVELGVYFFLSTLTALGIQDRFRARGSDRLIGWLFKRKLQVFKH